MLGLKFFVLVQIFQRRLFVPSQNFCHPVLGGYILGENIFLETLLLIATDMDDMAHIPCGETFPKASPFPLHFYVTLMGRN